MRVIEEMAEMMARDKEEGWTEVAEDYETAMECSDWVYEDMEEGSASEMGENYMESNFKEDGVMTNGFEENACREAADRMEEAAKEELIMAQDDRGMGVIEIVLIIVVLIGLVVVFRGGISAALDTIIKGISGLVDGFF